MKDEIAKSGEFALASHQLTRKIGEKEAMYQHLPERHPCRKAARYADDYGMGAVKFGRVIANLHLKESKVSNTHWLRKIEALRPGDACEIKNNLDGKWTLATVRVNGMAGYWEVVVERPEGPCVINRYIENVRCPGQTDAWPRSRP